MMFLATTKSVEKFEKEHKVRTLIHTKNTQSVLDKIRNLDSTCKQAGPIILAEIPFRHIEEIASLDDVKFIEASVQAKLHLDDSIRDIGLIKNSVQSSYTGDGVIIGIIDTGIDWTHQDFIKVENGKQKSRILYLLDQIPDVPREYTNDDINQALQTGTRVIAGDEEGHGTHVAGIAAGNGQASNGKYCGVARSADLIIVKSTLETEDIGKAIIYIFSKAEELKRPCVINMSFGWHTGSHDGREGIEQIIDSYSGNGKAVCISAGNEAEEDIHTSGSIKNGGEWATDFSLIPFMFRGNQVAVVKITLIHHFRDDIDFRLRSPRGAMVAPSTNPENTLLIGNARISFVKTTNVYSNNPEYTIEIILLQFKPDELRGWRIEGHANNVEIGRIDAWIHSEDHGAFTSNIDREMLVCMPGTSYSAITVGSYNTKNAWDSENGKQKYGTYTIGEISPFSSPGPTRDGRTKPEICAPGCFIMSALSSQVPAHDIDPEEKDSNYPYCINAGTSMACPHVTGAVALLLEKNPQLHSDIIKWKIIQSAKQDAFTGPTWNSRWGFGKLNLTTLISD